MFNLHPPALLQGIQLQLLTTVTTVTAKKMQRESIWVDSRQQ